MSNIEKTIVTTPSGPKVLVSTVLLDNPIGNMFDLLFSVAVIRDYGDGPFETMVFSADEDGEVSDFAELYCERYTSECDAKDGHLRIVKGVGDGSIVMENANG